MTRRPYFSTALNPSHKQICLTENEAEFIDGRPTYPVRALADMLGRNEEGLRRGIRYAEAGVMASDDREALRERQRIAREEALWEAHMDERRKKNRAARSCTAWRAPEGSAANDDRQTLTRKVGKRT